MRLMALLGLTFGAATFADSPPPAAEVLAREAFSRGEKAFTEDDYDGALGFFRRAFELSPHDAVRFNIAVCLERLARFREAVQQYETAAQSPQLDEAARLRARAQAARLRERLGTLVVVGEPVGAEVLVDGEPMCFLPCRVAVDPRVHQVAARAHGTAARGTVSVERGAAATLSLKVVPLPAAPPASGAVPKARLRMGALGWSGVGVAALGAGAVALFGARAQGLHGEYVRHPAAPLRDEGIRMRDLANGSIAVACAGAAAAVVDLFLLSRPKPEEAAGKE